MSNELQVVLVMFQRSWLNCSLHCGEKQSQEEDYDVNLASNLESSNDPEALQLRSVVGVIEELEDHTTCEDSDGLVEAADFLPRGSHEAILGIVYLFTETTADLAVPLARDTDDDIEEEENDREGGEPLEIVLQDLNGSVDGL